MKCTHCNKNEANTHFKKIINGKKEEMYLCEECAKELGVMDEFSFDPFAMDSYFGNLLGAGASAFNSLVGIDRCSKCGSSLNDIISTGHVGCADCYDKFEDRLNPSIQKLHSRAKHIGKTISYTEEPEPQEEPVSKLEQLKQELKTAVQEQRFEDAAVLRDKIKELSQGE